MVFVAAGNAPEGGLVRPVFRRNMTAGETGPARVFGIHPDQTFSPPRKLVVQEGEKHSPPPGQDGAVQSGLLPDLSSGGLFCSPGAFGHVPDLQVLDIDDGLGFADRCRFFVEKIQAHVSNPLLCPRNAELLFPKITTFWAFPILSGKFALLPNKLFLYRPHGPNNLRLRVNPRTVGQSGKRNDAKIQSDLRKGSFCWYRNVRLGLQGDGPPTRLPGHGGVSEIADDRTGNPNLDPPHLGEKDPGKEIPSRRIPGREVEIDLAGIGIAEGVSLSLPLEPGESLGVRLIQGFPKGPVKVLEGLLLGMDRTQGQEALLLARPPQGQELGQVPVGEKRNPGIEPSRLEIEGLVPDEPDAPRVAGQETLLFGSRDESEFERFHSFHVRKLRTESQCMDGFAVHAILPLYEWQGLPRVLIKNIFPFKSEDYPPVSIHANRPEPCKISFQRMKFPLRSLHLFRTSDHIQGGQNGPKLSGMVRSDTRSGSRSEKFFEALMPKVSNHENAVSCHLSLVNFATTQRLNDSGHPDAFGVQEKRSSTAFLEEVQYTEDGHPFRPRLPRGRSFSWTAIGTWGHNICLPPARSYPMIFPTSGNWPERDISIVLASRNAARTASKSPFPLGQTLRGNVKNVLHGTYHAVREKHFPRDLAKFRYRFNRQFQLQDLLPRFMYVALRTPPLPYRRAKMAEKHG